MKIASRYLELGKHNDLAGIQGGTMDGDGKVVEAYHLDKANYDNVAGVTEAVTALLDSGFDIAIEHNALQKIQGGATDGDGNVTEAYHLTQEEFDNVQTILLYAEEIIAETFHPDHNRLKEIQGGGNGEYYHLTEQQHNGAEELFETCDEIVNAALHPRHNELR